MISIIMPSFLGLYKHCASDRDLKIVRAIESVLNQSCEDWELMVVADGCKQTVEIVRGFSDKRIRGLHIEKKVLFSGTPRNTGIYFSKGEYIVYLDVDDMFGKDHLKKIVSQVKDYDWVWFYDRSYNVKKQKTGFIKNPQFEDFDIHETSIHVRGRCGTSNIAHKRSMNVWWPKQGTYFQDYILINTLKAASKNYGFLNDTPEYLICHVPQLLDI